MAGVARRCAKRSVTPAIWCSTRLSPTARDYGDSSQDAPCRYNHLANRLKEAQASPGSRVAVPGLPHHVTQRGNRREPVFFEADAGGRPATTRIERAPTIDRPLGRPEWIAMLGRLLALRKPGPKPRVERDTPRQAQLL